MVQVGNPTPTTVALSDASSVRADKPLHFFIERYADAYAAELDQFIDSVLAGAAPAPGLEDARRALCLAEAAARSAKSGRFEPVAD